MGWNPFSGRGLVDIATFGQSRLIPEDTLAKIPGVNSLTGAKSDADKALLAKQEQLAQEARRQQERNAQARMQALGQSMLAFNPRNQAMAAMYGPEAAFTPDQFAQMANDPNAKPTDQAQQAWLAASKGPLNQDLTGRAPIPQQIQSDLEAAYANDRRKKQIAGQMTPVGPGPAPLGPRQAPQQSRRF